MRNIRSLYIGVLVGASLFLICNCAGYVAVSFVGPALIQEDSQINHESPSDNAPPAEVVAFNTAAPAEAALATPTPPSIAGTPLPLVPTVTPGEPANTPAPPEPTLLPPTAEAEAEAVAPEPSPTRRPTRNVQIDAAAELEILSHRSYVDELGWHHIVGEVQNNASVPVEYVEVTARLYDEANEVIGTKLTFTAPDVIYPGDKAPFDVVTLRRSQWRRIVDYTLEVNGDVAPELLDEKLVLLNQTSWIDGDWLYVQGEVQNTGDEPALVKLIVTLYDAQLQVINTNWSYADSGIISTGATSAFTVKIDHKTDPNNFSYRIQIEEETVDGEYAEDLEEGTN